MAGRPPKKSYKDHARELKKLGLINWDLRQSPNRYRKDRVKQLSSQYKHLLDNPQDFFVKKLSGHQKANLKNSGVKIVNSKLIMPKKGYTELHVKTQNGKTEIIRKSATKTSRAKFFKSGIALLNKLESMKPKEGQYYTVGGEDWHINRVFETPQELYEYLQKFKESQIVRFSIVTLKEEDFE